MPAVTEKLSGKLEERIRCPRCKSRLSVGGAHLSCEVCKATYGIKRGKVTMFDLYIDDQPQEAGRDPEQVWDREGFEKGYEAIGYHESGTEFEKVLGWPEEVSQYHFERVKQRMVDWVQPGEGHAILDVGCGAGYFLCLIREKYVSQGFSPRIAGVDISAHQASFMAKRMEKEGVLDAVACLGNSEYLPFADNTFDLVTCSEVLEHVRNPLRALSEMRRVLKPDGILNLSTPSMTAETSWDRVLAPFVLPIKWLLGHKSDPKAGRGGYDVPWHPKELRRAFESVGLEIRKFEQNGIIPHVHYLKFLPRVLVKPVVWMSEIADRFFWFALKPLAWHLLVCATKGEKKGEGHARAGK